MRTCACADAPVVLRGFRWKRGAGMALEAYGSLWKPGVRRAVRAGTS